MPNPEDAGKLDLDEVAQELLGIDISAADFDDDLLDLDDDELGPPDSPVAEESVSDEPEAADSTVMESGDNPDFGSTDDDFDDDFGGGLGLFDFGDDDEETQEVPKAETPPPKVTPQPVSAALARSEPEPAPSTPRAQQDTPPPPSAETETDSTSGEKSASKSEPDDDYWDALDGWDWDESDSKAKKSAPGRRTGEKTVTAAPANTRARKRRPSPLLTKLTNFLTMWTSGPGSTTKPNRARRPRLPVPNHA